jgi:hypothetical protein
MQTDTSSTARTASGHTSLIAADRVEGTSVYNRAGESLGTIDEIMIDKITGKVAYAVMSFGGFLGMGERHHPLPWGVLKYDTELGGYVVDLDKDTLRNAPSYAKDETYDYEQRQAAKELHDYYRVPPYWM